MVNLYFCGKDIRVYDLTRVIYLGEIFIPLKKNIKITNYIIHKQNAPHDSEKTNREHED